MFKWVFWGVIAISFLTVFDHAMRVNQEYYCAIGDTIRCPETLWWFETK